MTIQVSIVAISCIILTLALDRYWLLLEIRGRDPMSCPVTCRVYRSAMPRGQGFHNIRSSPSVKGAFVKKVPTGSQFLGIEEVRNDEGVWIVLHEQTVHSFDIASATPCYLCAVLGDKTLVERLKWCVCCTGVVVLPE